MEGREEPAGGTGGPVRRHAARAGLLGRGQGLAGHARSGGGAPQAEGREGGNSLQEGGGLHDHTVALASLPREGARCGLLHQAARKVIILFISVNVVK